MVTIAPQIVLTRTGQQSHLPSVIKGVTFCGKSWTRISTVVKGVSCHRCRDYAQPALLAAIAAIA